MQDAWRAYLEMALGLTEAPRKKAQKVAGDLVNRGGATAVQLQGLVEDLMSTGMANREALTNIVRYEVERALGVVGLASAEEVTELNNRVTDLERRLREAQAGAGATGEPLVASTVTGAATGGDRLDRPAPLPVKKTVAKAAKATPNAMPKAATTPPPAKTATTPPAPAAPAAPATKKAAKVAPAPAPAKAAKKAPAAKKAAKTAPPAPAGTAEAPTAAVKEAASTTELPPAKKTAAKKAPAKKVAPPAKFIDPGV